MQDIQLSPHFKLKEFIKSQTARENGIDNTPPPEAVENLNVIFSFCREINGEKKNFCLVTNPRKKLKYRMFTEAES